MATTLETATPATKRYVNIKNEHRIDRKAETVATTEVWVENVDATDRRAEGDSKDGVAVDHKADGQEDVRTADLCRAVETTTGEDGKVEVDQHQQRETIQEAETSIKIGSRDNVAGATIGQVGKINRREDEHQHQDQGD